jgi:hypothetical protein
VGITLELVRHKLTNELKKNHLKLFGGQKAIGTSTSTPMATEHSYMAAGGEQLLAMEWEAALASFDAAIRLNPSSEPLQVTSLPPRHSFSMING